MSQTTIWEDYIGLIEDASIQFLVELGPENLKDISRIIFNAETEEKAKEEIRFLLRDFNRSANYKGSL